LRYGFAAPDELKILEDESAERAAIIKAKAKKG
jgi:hypothetical protein